MCHRRVRTSRATMPVSERRDSREPRRRCRWLRVLAPPGRDARHLPKRGLAGSDQVLKSPPMTTDPCGCRTAAMARACRPRAPAAPNTHSRSAATNGSRWIDATSGARRPTIHPASRTPRRAAGARRATPAQQAQEAAGSTGSRCLDLQPARSRPGHSASTGCRGGTAPTGERSGRCRSVMGRGGAGALQPARGRAGAQCLRCATPPAATGRSVPRDARRTIPPLEIRDKGRKVAGADVDVPADDGNRTVRADGRRVVRPVAGCD